MTRPSADIVATAADDPARVKSHSATAMTQYLIWYAADLETMSREPAHDYPDIS